MSESSSPEEGKEFWILFLLYMYLLPFHTILAHLIVLNRFKMFRLSRMGGDSNDKPMAIRSRPVARSQCCTTVLIGTGLLNAPDVYSTDYSQP